MRVIPAAAPERGLPARTDDRRVRACRGLDAPVP